MERSLPQPTQGRIDKAPRESLWRRLDARRHVGAALGWTAFLLGVAGALVAAELAAGEAERHVVADTRARLGQTAAQTADALTTQVEVRLAAMQAAAAQWRLDSGGAATPAERLNALRQVQPALSWIGVRDTAGALRAATDGAGVSTAPPPWLARALRVPLVALHRGVDASGANALVLAVPLAAPGDPPTGILEARLPWLWLQAQLDAQLRALTGGAPIELVLLGPAGGVLAGPPALQGQAAGVDLSEGGRYVVGQQPAAAGVDGHVAAATGWRVVVRENAYDALAHARQTRRAVLLGVLVVGLLSALAVAAAARRLLRRLDELARQAHAVRAGARSAIEVPGGHDEVHAIGATLAQLVAHLQDEKAALAALNAELDARVAARAARIEQLAAEARQAAVTRERLRLARGLHDTLAHSLMALLTEIRVLRKLGPRWSPAQLDAELADAEQVAAQGLAEARAAIAQMRDEGLAGSGLGAALQALLTRFAERSGVATQAHIDPAASALADERAATVLNMAREALRNVEQHAQARQVVLTLAPEPAPVTGTHDDEAQRWCLELADDGIGFDPAAAPAGHYGLAGLREQAEQLGATLSLDSAPGHGSRVRLRFAA